MRRFRPALIAVLAALAMACSGAAVAGSLHDDPAAIGHIDAAISELQAAKGDLTAPPPTVTASVTQTATVSVTATATATVTPPPVTTTATVTATPSPTPTVRLLFGACPQSGSSSVVSGIDAKYGTKAQVVRLFQSQPTTIPTDRTVIVSWSAATLDLTVLKTWAAALPAGQTVYWTHRHEIDSKVRGGKVTDLAAWRAGMDAAAAAIASVNPKATLIPTTIITAWEFNLEPAATVLSKFVPASVKALGVDFDGDDTKPGPVFPQFAWAVAGVKTVAQLRPDLAFIVPEFAAPESTSAATDDPGGVKRAAYLTAWGKTFRDLGARAVALFDYPGIYGAREPLRTTAEIAAWKALTLS